MNKKDKTPFTLKVVRWVYPKLERLAPALARRYFVRLFFTPLRYEVPEKEKEALLSARHFSIMAAGKKVVYHSWGSGHEVVMLLHGWAGRSTQLRKFIEPFNERGYRVIGIDGPAHGSSEGKSTNIIEFEEALKVIFREVGTPAGIIAHSFGGGAVLYSAMNGLPVKKVINIATPTIASEIIDVYLKAINGSKQTGDYFRTYVFENLGKSFEEFTSIYFVKHLPQPVDLLLVHDEDDKEVNIRQARALIEIYPKAELYATRGLGHTRILKDDAVVQKCVTFIAGEPSKD